MTSSDRKWRYKLKHVHVVPGGLCVCVRLLVAVQLLENSDPHTHICCHAGVCVWPWDGILRLCTNTYVIHHNCCQRVCLTRDLLSPPPLGTEPQWVCALNTQVCVTVGQKWGCLYTSLHLSVLIWLPICCVCLSPWKWLTNNRLPFSWDCSNSNRQGVENYQGCFE